MHTQRNFLYATFRHWRTHTLESRYETYDDTGTTTTEIKGSMRYKAIIAAPTKMEAADGATATLVFYVDSTIAG